MTRPSLALAAVATVQLLAATAAIRAAPNIVVILTDDQGYGDVGCFGSPNIRTPHLDELARDGVRFTCFYAAPICGPSRAALMTGCYPPRVGLAFNHNPGATTGVHPGETTIAEMLRAAGYATCLVGKWHLGDAPAFLPTRHGFDEYFGLPYSNDMSPLHEMLPLAAPYESAQRAVRERAAFTGSAWKPGRASLPHPFETPLPLLDGEQVVETMPAVAQLTSRYAQRAEEFIRAHADQPFFLLLAHSMPHVYLGASSEFRGRSARGLYGDVIMEIDESVGQIRRTLRELGIERNTLLIFTSDNGPWLAYGVDGGSAGPLRGGKQSTWEGGVRVPTIAAWPDAIPAGGRCDAIAASMDLWPTFAELAGQPLPAGRTLDGRSLRRLLADPTAASPHQHFFYFGKSTPGTTNLEAVRDQRWKLRLSRQKDGALAGGALYDLGADVGESFDRAVTEPAAAARLLRVANEFDRQLNGELRPLGTLAAP